MTTREENIKKINENLEQLTDDELEQVAGGTYNNTAADSRILNKMGFNIQGKSADDLFWSQSKFRDTAHQVNKIFNGFGISVDQSWGAVTNRYYFGGEEITCEQAFKIVATASGKPMPDISY